MPVVRVGEFFRPYLDLWVAVTAAGAACSGRHHRGPVQVITTLVVKHQSLAPATRGAPQGPHHQSLAPVTTRAQQVTSGAAGPRLCVNAATGKAVSSPVRPLRGHLSVNNAVVYAADGLPCQQRRALYYIMYIV